MVALTKLKECAQELWLGKEQRGFSGSGICFYMASYVEDYMWNEGKYIDALAKAKSVSPTTIVNWAKVKNMSDRQRHWQHRNNAGYLKNPPERDYICMVSLFVAGENEVVTVDLTSLAGSNHEAIVAFSHPGRVLFFEPNFGFFEAVEEGKSNRKILEEAIRSLYRGIQCTALNFQYLQGRHL